MATLMELIAYLMERLRDRCGTLDFPIQAENGTDYGGMTGQGEMTGQGPAHLEIDWEKLQQEMLVFEKEFSALKESPA